MLTEAFHNFLASTGFNELKRNTNDLWIWSFLILVQWASSWIKTLLKSSSTKLALHPYEECSICLRAWDNVSTPSLWAIIQMNYSQSGSDTMVMGIFVRALRKKSEKRSGGLKDPFSWSHNIVWRSSQSSSETSLSKRSTQNLIWPSVVMCLILVASWLNIFPNVRAMLGFTR